MTPCGSDGGAFAPPSRADTTRPEPKPWPRAVAAETPVFLVWMWRSSAEDMATAALSALVVGGAGGGGSGMAGAEGWILVFY